MTSNTHGPIPKSLRFPSGGYVTFPPDFVVRPGADPAKIRLAYLGAESVTLTDDGALDIGTPLGGFRDERSVAYQAIDGKKVAVDVSYDFVKKDQGYDYGFRLGSYDKSKELIIDPAVVIYAGFIGGSGLDSGNDIAVDGDGNAYVTGITASSNGSFPATAGSLDTGYNGGTNDAFVAKVKADGTALDYAGFIGGSGDDVGFGIASAMMQTMTTRTPVSTPASPRPAVTEFWRQTLRPATTPIETAGQTSATANVRVSPPPFAATA